MARFDITIDNCKTGISVSHGGLERIQGSIGITDCGVGVQERDPPNIAELIGLPSHTPSDQLIEILNVLKSHQKVDEAQKLAHIKRSRIWDVIEGTANVAGIAANLIAISADPALGQIIETLKMTLRK